MNISELLSIVGVCGIESFIDVSKLLSIMVAALNISSMSLNPASSSWAFTTFATFVDAIAAIGKVLGVGRVAGRGEL